MNSLSSILSQVAHENMCTAAFFVRGREILIGLRNYASGSVWTTPGGRCEAGETIESGIRRETLEEVGIVDFQILAYLWDVKAASIESSLSVFICETGEEPRLMEPDKFSSWRWESIDSIPENFINIPALDLVKQYFLSK